MLHQRQLVHDELETGGLSSEAFISPLAVLVESRGQPKSIVTAWMQCHLSFSLRSAILFIRGTRNKPHQIVKELHYTDFEVDAWVGRINRSTHG